MRTVDLLVRDGTVLTIDGKMDILRGSDVVIDGPRIVDLCPADASVERYEPRRTINATGCLVMPGFINTHTHSPLTMLRGVSDDLPLMEWLKSFIWPFENRFVTREFVATATRLAIHEMALSGTTTFNDSYFFCDEVARVAKEMGIRCVAGEIVLDAETPSHDSPQAAFAYLRECIQEWRGDDLVQIAVAPHSPYACSREVLRDAVEVAGEGAALLNIHVSESEWEVQDILTRYGRTPVEYLENLGCFTPRSIAAHCVHLRDADMERLAEHRVGVAHNPESNLKLGNGVAPIARLIALGVAVGLGTDGAASNNDLNLLGEVDFAAKLQKGHFRDPTLLRGHEAIRMLTIEGARALGLDGDIGSLEVGKRADVIVIDADRPHMQPMYDAYSHLVYAAQASDVRTVVVDGRVVVEDRQLLGHPFEDISEDVRRLGSQISQHLGLSG